MMIYFKMVKEDVSCLDESKTLLSGPEYYLPVVNDEEGLLQGVYLYYDSNDRVWIRSGKVTGTQANGCNFSVRHNEHVAKAKTQRLTTKTSIFYIAYPSRDLP